MKKFALCSLVAMSGALFAAEGKGVTAALPSRAVSALVDYNHRMTVFHPMQQSYEYVPYNGLYLGVEAHGNNIYNINTHQSNFVAHAEIKAGHSIPLGDGTMIRPQAGIGIRKNYGHVKGHLHCSAGEPTTTYAFIGALLEREMTPFFIAGVKTKVMLGTDLKPAESGSTDLHYGLDIGMPLTFRVGESKNWDITLEPHFLALNDGGRYIGHRSAIAYRF